MNALEFDWSPGSNTFQVIDTDVTDAAVTAWDKRYFIPGDINGDGRDDILYRNANNFWMMRFSTGEAFTPPRLTGIPSICSDCDLRIRPIDFDRDGRMDVMVEIPDDVFDTTWFALYRSTGSTYEHVFTDPMRFHKNHPDDFVDGLWGGFFADIDGNGLPDYLGASIQRETVGGPGLSLRWRYRLNDGSGSFSSSELGPVWFAPMENPGDSVPFDYQIRTMTNGWRGQLLLMATNFYDALFFDESGLGGSLHAAGLPSFLAPENADRRNLHLADVNGDGLDDAVYPCTSMAVQLSSGLGFSELLEGPSAYAPCPEVADDRLRVRAVDFTADGSDDLLVIHTGTPTGVADHERGIQVYTWTGRSFHRLPTGIGTTGTDGFNPIGAIQPLDWNGDGLMDIAQIWRTGNDINTSFIRIQQRNGDIPGKLIRVNVAGLGPRVEVDYTTLANSSVHTSGAENCTYPLMCPRRGGSIVSKHWLANGMTSGEPWHEFSHQYTAARVDLRGRGWLGFERHSTRDEERPDAVTTAFFDNHTTAQIPLDEDTTAYVQPFAGEPYKVLRTLTSGTVNGSLVTYEHSTEKAFRLVPSAVPGTWVRRLDAVTVSDRERIGAGAWTSLHSSTTTFNEHDQFENVKKATTVVPGSDRVQPSDVQE